MRPRAALLAALLGAAPAAAQDLAVFAAASLGPALEDVAAGFEAATGLRAAIVAAGSPVIARQVRAGAPADVIVLASADWMDALEDEGLIAPGTRADIAAGTLVLIGPAGAAPVPMKRGMDLAGRLGAGRLAIPLVDAVPAGQYGRAALASLGEWDALAPAAVQTDNVRAALALVALGEAAMGVVYATDAAAEPRVAILGAFPAATHPPVAYPAARAARSAHPAAADAFLAHLRGPAGRAALAAAGFEPPRPAP